ncbi:MAG: RagB/SusD protein [Gemmatimonadetes bacterium]|nr:RagB/SusD protein [Gemmatimonadota bacterium]
MTSFMKPRAAIAAVLVGALALSSCKTNDILQVTDPDIINPTDVQSAAGAAAVRTGAIGRLSSATSGGSTNSEGLFLLSGLLADEWINGDSFIARQEVDQRVITTANTFLTDVDRMLQRARLSGVQAVQLLKQYSPLGPTADVAEMYFVQAYAENVLAEDWCNGLVISGVVNGAEQYGSPMTNVQVYTLALAHADSGLALITGTSTADVKVRNALALTRGRILVNLNRQAEAATAVASVPTSYNYLNYYLAVTNDNAIWTYNNTARRYSMSSGEGTNGLNFGTAADPRVKSCLGGDAACVAAGTTIKGRDDGTVPVTVQLLWPTRDASVSLASGVEARMIEAEAAYKAGNFAGMITKLNQARTDAAITGLTATLVDPGTNVARENLLFREKAFWTFGRGVRLGDMRRLVRQYGRTTESVFPTGAWHKAGNYGTDVNFPVPQAEQNNPNVPAGNNTCIDRSA